MGNKGKHTHCSISAVIDESQSFQHQNINAGVTQGNVSGLTTFNCFNNDLHFIIRLEEDRLTK